jgi:hypothetical protein
MGVFLASCGSSSNSTTSAPPNSAPTITSQPVAQTVTAGQPATFSVTATGTAPLTYQWFLNSTAVGTNSNTFSIAQTTTAQNQALINVKVSNAAGAVTSATVTLTVNAGSVAPTITQQPVAQTVTAGQPATFSVTATGTAPLTYQWFMNSTAAGTNSSTFTISQTTSTDNQAQIHVTVTNTIGSVTSSTVTLTVNQATSTTSVLTYHNDNLRTGQNVNETILTPANVTSATFGKLFALTVDGQVFAQPLYLPGVTLGTQVHNLLFVATEHDSVYAWDADTSSSTPIWQTSFINPSAGVTPIPCGEAAAGDCATITPEFGITSTPVIDSSTGTLYVVAGTKEVFSGTTSYVYRLHALSTTTGQEKFGGPVVIQASAGSVNLVAKQELQRPGLLLVNGVVYIGFGSHGDQVPFYGWLLGYSANNIQNRVMAFNAAPSGGGASIWQSGCAPAADANGSIYFLTGNGAFDANTGGLDYGDSVVKLNANGTVADYFTPSDQASLNSTDTDLGSSGLVLLPDQPGTFAHLLIAGGKQGVIYSVNRDNLGKFNTAGNQNIQSLAALSAGPASGGLFGSPAFWNGNLYFSAWNDNVKAFHLSNGMLTKTSQSAIQLAFPGSTPSVSANGASNGIVWIIEADVLNDTVLTTVPPAVLRAYDATNLGVELYDSNQAGSRDTAGGAVKFAVPTIVNGKVYVGNRNQVTVYGLLH